ncbi:unnamed protein product, partial [Fusarium graminearum]
SRGSFPPLHLPTPRLVPSVRLCCGVEVDDWSKASVTPTFVPYPANSSDLGSSSSGATHPNLRDSFALFDIILLSFFSRNIIRQKTYDFTPDNSICATLRRLIKMEPMRGVSGGMGKQPAQQETPEQLLDVFKAAALSVTKLYKISAAGQSKARADGYQDCLDDLVQFLDKEGLGLRDGEGRNIRKWATERLDGRENSSMNTESEDEAEKVETASSPEISRQSVPPQQPSQMRTDSAPPSIPPIHEEPTPIVVPSQDSFNFQSSHPYPNIATLDLSDSRSHDDTPTLTRSSKSRLTGNSSRACPRGAGHLVQRAGSKRKLNFDEIFDLGSLSGKDTFGNGGKRSRHA